MVSILIYSLKATRKEVIDMNDNERFTEPAMAELIEAIKTLTAEIQHLSCLLECQNNTKK